MRTKRVLVLGAGLVLAVVAYRLLRENFHQTVVRSLAAPTIGVTSIAAGLIAWSRRPGIRVGPLMVLFGFAVLVRTWQYSDEPVVFTLGFGLGEFSLALFAHFALAYPSGRITDRLERLLVYAVYGATILLPLTTLLFYDGGPHLTYVPAGTESALLVWANGDLVELLQDAFVVVVYGGLASCFIALVLRRFFRATPRARHVLTPMLLAAVIAALRALYEFVSTFVSPVSIIADYLYWWQVVGQIALPVALLAGLLSSRLAVAQVADLVRTLDRVPPGELRGALAHAVGDPTLDIAFWLPERGAYADADGRERALPGPGERRAVTRLEQHGEPIAAIVHDSSLDDDPELVEAAAAAARLALENARLHAEVKAQLTQVQESRARIVAAGDEQRRRIERDLHDGAQQRLVALALQLRSGQRRLGEGADPEMERLLGSAVDELKVAVDELRELARGVHPAILTEEGLVPALESLVSRTPFRVSLDAPVDRPIPAEAEATAYFLVSEALVNVAKHAHASHAAVRAKRLNDLLLVVVEDDGVGGASPRNGSGLRGLADRVEALGGRLRIESPVGCGTRIVGEIPCAS